MIGLEQIRNFFPPLLRDNPAQQKYLVKEYIQLLILDNLATTSFVRKMAFIGGTSLRLIKGIDRFSEDLDFDCKDFSKELQKSIYHTKPVTLNISCSRKETANGS